MGRERHERAALVALTLMHGAKQLGLTSSQLRAHFNRGDLPSAVLAGTGEHDSPDEGLFPVPSTDSDDAAAKIRERLLADARERILT